MDPGLGTLDLTDMDTNQNWTVWKLNSGPETGLKARKFGFKVRTKYGVYIHH